MHCKITSIDIYNFLLKEYKQEWWNNDPYRVMVESILVQNTTWKQVEKAEKQFEHDLSPEWIEGVDENYFSNLILSCRYGKVKTKTIKRITTWYKKYGYNSKNIEELPTKQIRDELLDIKGIGPETADDILVYAFNKPSFIIDAYTRRLLVKLGFNFKNDDEIRKFLTKGIPEDAKTYGLYHGAILQYYKDVKNNDDIKTQILNYKNKML